jgi:flagellar motor component MotA
VHRRAEIEYLKLMAVINAIIATGNSIAAAVTGNESSGGDSVNKTLESLKELLLPHWKEEQDRKAIKAKELLRKEVAGGPIRVQVVGKGKKKHGRH